MIDTAKEGVIKFVSFPDSGSTPIKDPKLIEELDRWRSVLVLFNLIGQYEDGVGFGNVSMRLPSEVSDGLEFIVTGSQTGHLERLTLHDYVRITRCSPEDNTVWYAREGRGRKHAREPSSESMTHYAVYAGTDAEFVLHAHSRLIWDRMKALKIPATPVEVEYGTPEMVMAITNLVSRRNVSEGQIIAMAGHKDGVVTWGKTADEAGFKLLEYQNRAAKPLRLKSCYDIK